MEMETEAETPQQQPPPPESTPSSSKKKRKQRSSTPTTPWSHDETAHLIDAYREKWESLRRGQLKSGHWEEVSVTVAARSGHDDPAASKSALQCRHKMEKLRQRFRSESSRAAPSPWPFFAPMSLLQAPPGDPPPTRPTAGDGDGDGDGLVWRLAVEIRGFAARMAAVETAKMESAREIERARMEMERKRIDLIVTSQTKILDSIARVLGA